MPLYFVLVNLTQKGVEHIKDLPKWAKDAGDVVKSVGGEVKGLFHDGAIRSHRTC
jgi:uncharacterized protein with GYD domain